MKILSSIFFLFLSVTLTAQIPNAGFENWTNNLPDNWYANNLPPFYITVTKSTTAHSGTGAARGEVVSYAETSVPPILITGNLGGQGFPFTDRPASLKGYFQFNPVLGDNFYVIVILYDSSQIIGSGEFFSTSSVNSYTEFGAGITYINTTVIPNMCYISIGIIPAVDSSDVHLGSTFLLDDLEFSDQAVGVGDENLVNTFYLEQNYPNPFNPSTRIRYEIPSEDFVTLKIYDALGSEITTLVNETKAAGSYYTDFNASGLSNGIYFYKLTSGALSTVKKMILVK